MSRPLLYTLTAIVLLSGIGFYLCRENKILQYGKTGKDYLAFNRSDHVETQKIISSWRANDKLSKAVKSIVIADLFLIIVYTTYLLWAIRFRREIIQLRPSEGWLVRLLSLACCCVVAGVILDVVQDCIIYVYVSSKDGEVTRLFWLTWVKLRLLGLGILLLVISLAPVRWRTKIKLDKFLIYFAGILKSIWLFFPSILFIYLTIVCFWKQDQGKDILVAFTESHNNLFRIFFFVAIGFWVYVTWYSSRVIGYIKERHRPIFSGFLRNYPRLAGTACFLVIELAALQAPVLQFTLKTGWAWVIFGVLLFAFYLLDKHISALLQKDNGRLASRYWIVFLLFFIVLVVICLIDISRSVYIFVMLFLLILLHIIYLFYINLHRVKVGPTMTRVSMDAASGTAEKTMAFFCIPKEEKAFIKWLIITTIVSVIVYTISINWLAFARGIGPFSMVLLAFAILLAFGNFITALSVRMRMNFHFLFLILAFFIGKNETHYVQQLDLNDRSNAYNLRPQLHDYLKVWLGRLPKDNSSFDIYFVLANGGASRSGYWTASVLGKLEDSSRRACPADPFSNHLFCLSGTSGGGVGVATFFALLNDHDTPRTPSYQQSASSFLGQDYFTFTLARMLGPDYFNYVFQLPGTKDRGRALEQSFEKYGDADTLHGYKPLFDQPFSSFSAMNEDRTQIRLPILFVNTTRMQDGSPGVVTNLFMDTAYFGGRIDVLHLLDRDKDISMASAAILGARFPYLSPAGRIRNDYYVDGGYFDNSGAGAVQELIRGILDLAKKDTVRGGDSIIYKGVHRLRFQVLHIVNSPVNISDTTKKVEPIINDLLSPIKTIIGAYDMQTTVNDARLYHYIDDINNHEGIPAEHGMISLYKDSLEWNRAKRSNPSYKEPPYSMNWFISDTTRKRIDQRLYHHHVIDSVHARLNQSSCK